jgi:hypothetical protein
MTTGPTPDGSPPKDRPLGELIGNITDDLSTLFRKEIELAKAEARHEGKKVAMATGMYAGAAVAGLLTAIMLSFALVYALSEIMHPGWAAFILTIVWAFVGLLLYYEARRKLKTVEPLPQTTQSLKENAQWLQNPTG